jgi:hypothetical protein
MPKNSVKTTKPSGKRTARTIKDCLDNAKMARAWAAYWEDLAKWYKRNAVGTASLDPGGNPPTPPPKVPPGG